MQDYKSRLLKAIPGGAHTYSRGYDQYPDNAPDILSSGKGAYVMDPNNNKYLDYGMGCRAVNIGYAEEEINQAAIAQILNGNNLTRPSMIELQASELIIDLIDSVDMVKFTKNGSTAVSAAVKLSRAYTGRDLIARCAQHPFFSYDDWFIGSTPVTRGIPKSTIAQTKFFNYNDLDSLQKLIDEYPDRISCVVLEPSTDKHPSPSSFVKGETYLHDVKRLCEKNGIVFILDEMITGFRWHLKGAQKYYNIESDLCTFGKAMANGFSVAAVAGKRDIMKLGSIETTGEERVFLLSTTHGAEMSGLGAFIQTVEFISKNNVIEHIWSYGRRLIDTINEQAKAAGIEDYFNGNGIECSPYYVTYDEDKNISLPFRTLFMQEMIANGVLIPWIALSYRHGEEELEITANALKKTFDIYGQALDQGVEKFLIGECIKPVFRQYN